MATRLKVIEDVQAQITAPVGKPIDPVNQSDPHSPQFEVAPTRKQHSGWTAERQRIFISICR